MRLGRVVTGFGVGMILVGASCSNGAPRPSGGAGADQANAGADTGAGDDSAGTTAQGGKKTPDAVITACAAVATLYPEDRLASTQVRDAVLGKHWAERDGGRGSMHGPPTLWRRNVDLHLTERGDVVAMAYTKTVESTGEAAETTKIEQDCHVCGDLLVCGETVWVLDVHVNDPPRGKPLEVLDLDAVAEVGDHDLYLVRHGHEILLDFAADPRTTSSGGLDIHLRKLAQGAVATKHTTTFESETMSPGYAGRTVRIDLPGVDGMRLEYRPEQRPDGGGYGTDPTLATSLYEMESLKRNPQLMEQPESLDIAPDAPGFNLPRGE